ncbi:MAG: hypothetical protein IJH94_00295 [Clostridia bacterium]|nr:hypothetical protein [Clostridia bacterium]
MADVRLATYTDLENEIRARETADSTLTESLDAAAATAAVANTKAEAAQSAADAARSTADEARDTARASVNTAADLAALVTAGKVYEGMAVYVSEAEKTYRYSSGVWVAENVAEIMICDALPSAETVYNNYDTPRFTAIERCSTAIITSENEAVVFERIRSASNAGNKYGYAKFEISGAAGADKVIIDMAVKIPSSRYLIGIGDMSIRPGNSNRSSYDKIGCAIYFGTKDGTNFTINGINRSTANAAIGEWADIHVEMYMKRKSLKYSISKNGAVLYIGEEPFIDTGVDSVSGIDAYTWTETAVYIGDISVNALYGAKENMLYVIPRKDDCADAFLYENNRPVKIGEESGIQSLAGKAFSVVAIDRVHNIYTLDSTDGLEIGMTYSVRLDKAVGCAGKITAINGNDITVDVMPDIPRSDDTEVTNYLTVFKRPDLGTIDVATDAFAFGEMTVAQDRAAFAEGRETAVVGQYGHAEGRETVSGYAAHAEGGWTTALGDYSHAEGQETTADYYGAHAEGYRTTASGQGAHAEGGMNTASGQGAHAEGYKTSASGEYSHAGGHNTIARAPIQTVIGRYNAANDNAAFIIGNGTAGSARSNAVEVEWSGTAKFAGTVEARSLILRSSTSGSTRRFRITVDDSGTLSAVRVE